MACRSLTVILAVLAPDNKRQVSFGLSKICQDANTAVYIIEFVLRDLIGGEFQDRVRLHVDVGGNTKDKDAAQALMDRGLSMTQLQLLKGPITARTKNLPAGTEKDQKAADLLLKVPKVA
ncbi:MAG: hypothetical protein QOD75_1585 [Blastocatellia bacterium]|jgi:hypothetical protein|nr:hypothetical protein [Blastocatellia bacterium]